MWLVIFYIHPIIGRPIYSCSHTNQAKAIMPLFFISIPFRYKVSRFLKTQTLLRAEFSGLLHKLQGKPEGRIRNNVWRVESVCQKKIELYSIATRFKIGGNYIVTAPLQNPAHCAVSAGTFPNTSYKSLDLQERLCALRWSRIKVVLRPSAIIVRSNNTLSAFCCIVHPASVSAASVNIATEAG